MIEYRSGDILRCEVDALVNTVNCVGVMGRGIALQFKSAYPDNFKAYALACKKGDVQPGRMLVFETGQITPPYYIINFPTKRHWRGKSRIEDIESGLTALVEEIRTRNIRSIAIPPLGSGMGGLEWRDVRRRIEAALRELAEVRVVVFEPTGSPDTDNMIHNREVPRMTAGRAALVGLMRNYLSGLLDPSVTLLELHKLMYFLQEAGEPLKLRYVKAPHGPYAENLRHVLHAIEGHLIEGYADGGDAPYKTLELVPGATEEASSFLAEHGDTQSRIERVAELTEGFESPVGLELLTSVHWLIEHENVTSMPDIVKHVHAWNAHKQQYTPRQIGIAARVLATKGWALLPSSASSP